MKVTRTAEGLDHRNTLVFNTLVLYFQCFADKAGSDADRAIAGVPWTLRAEGRVVATGTTEADGAVRVSAPVGVHSELEIFGTRYRLQAAPHLEAATTVAGQQRRLLMLGYDIGSADGTFGRRTDKAVLDFQANHGLNPDGVVGSQTRTRLTSQFGE